MNLYEHLFDLISEVVATAVVIYLGELVHLFFTSYRVRLWRTGPVCDCTP